MLKIAPVTAVFVIRWTASAATSAGPTTRRIGRIERSSALDGIDTRGRVGGESRALQCRTPSGPSDLSSRDATTRALRGRVVARPRRPVELHQRRRLTHRTYRLLSNDNTDRRDVTPLR